jgi:hypothetical protein
LLPQLTALALFSFAPGRDSDQKIPGAEDDRRILRTTLGVFWSRAHGTTVTRLEAVPLFASAAKANPHA